MSQPSQQFPFLSLHDGPRQLSLAPVLPLQLMAASAVSTRGLIDSGAAVNILPYRIGLNLGLKWDQLTIPVQVHGAYAGVPFRAVLIRAKIEPFPELTLAFAWAKTDDVRLVLGRVNFLQEFDVCIFGSRSLFEIRPKP